MMAPGWGSGAGSTQSAKITPAGSSALSGEAADWIPASCAKTGLEECGIDGGGIPLTLETELDPEHLIRGPRHSRMRPDLIHSGRWLAGRFHRHRERQVTGRRQRGRHLRRQTRQGEPRTSRYRTSDMLMYGSLALELLLPSISTCMNPPSNINRHSPQTCKGYSIPGALDPGTRCGRTGHPFQ